MREKVRRLLEVTRIMDNSISYMNLLVDQLLPSFKQAYNDLSINALLDNAIDQYKSLAKYNIDDLAEKFVDIYVEYFTEEDVDHLLAFYASTAGKKSLDLSGVMGDRITEDSQKWGEQLLSHIKTSLSTDTPSN